MSSCDCGFISFITVSIFALETLKLCLKFMKPSNYFFIFGLPFHLHELVIAVCHVPSQSCTINASHQLQTLPPNLYF